MLSIIHEWTRGALGRSCHRTNEKKRIACPTPNDSDHDDDDVFEDVDNDTDAITHKYNVLQLKISLVTVAEMPSRQLHSRLLLRQIILTLSGKV